VASETTDSGRSSSIDLVVLAALAALVVGGQTASKVVRDAAFLTEFDAQALPSVTLPGAASSIAPARPVRASVPGLGPWPGPPKPYGLQAVLYGVEWALEGAQPGLVAVLLHLQVAMFGSLGVSTFWSFVSDRESPHGAKVRLARIGIGGTLGGVLGGLCVLAVAHVGGVRGSLLGLSMASMAVAVGLLGWSRRAGPLPPTGTDATEPAMTPAFPVLTRSPLLRSLAALVVVVAVWEALVDFAFKLGAETTFSDPDDLVSFFAVFHTATSVTTLVLQSFVAERVLTRGGLAAGLSTLPAFVSVGLALSLVPAFAALVVYRALEASLANSLFRTTVEVLFVPIPRDAKRATKVVLDVLAARSGDALGAGLVLFTVVLELGAVGASMIAAAMGLLGLALVRPVLRGYGAALDEAVRAGQLSLPEGGIETSAGTLTESLSALDSRRVREAVASLERTSRSSTAPRALHGDETLEALVEALSDAAMRGRAGDALRARLFEATPTLCARLLDPATHVSIRARIPRLLAIAPTSLAASALVAGLGDPELDVRYECARGLHRVRQRDAAWRVPTEVLDDAVIREVQERGDRWPEARVLGRDGGPRPGMEREDRSLALAALLLSLRVDPERLWLAMHALSSSDPVVRSAALELLELIVPAAVGGPLIDALGRRHRARARPGAELLRVLLTSSDGTEG